MSSNTATLSKSSQQDPLIVRLLRNLTRLDAARLDQLYAAPSKPEVAFEQMVIASGLADERQIAEAYSKHYLLPFFDPPTNTPPPVNPSVAKVLPSELCRSHLIAPLSDDGQTLEVAVFSPDSLLLADEIRILCGRQMRPMFTPLSVVRRLLHVLYDQGSWTDPIETDPSCNPDSMPDIFTSPSDNEFVSFDELGADDDFLAEDDFVPDDEFIADDDFVAEDCWDDRPATALPASVIRSADIAVSSDQRRAMEYIDRLIGQALQASASGIHLEPFHDRCRVRLRVQGGLTETTPPSTSLVGPVVDRLKMLSQLEIHETDLPQEGTMTLRCGDQPIDLRVTTCPTVYGEKLVIRIVNQVALPHDLSVLGLDQRQRHDLTAAIENTRGLMLVTGPAGSGKTTTLYSCLNHLNDTATNICTVEDPVECKLGGINQIQTRPKVGLTLGNAMRCLLRQDPDVIMVSEMRDQETADLCTRAALTGRSVFSSLHGNDAFSSVMRLQELGVDPFLIASTLRLVVAQRLLRRLCDDCKTPQRITPETAQRYAIHRDTVVYQPRGCSQCGGSGHRGQLAVYEVVRIDGQISELIQQRQPVDAMKRVALAGGMQSLRQTALRSALAGSTSLREALQQSSQRRIAITPA